MPVSVAVVLCVEHRGGKPRLRWGQGRGGAARASTQVASGLRCREGALTLLLSCGALQSGQPRRPGLRER